MDKILSTACAITALLAILTIVFRHKAYGPYKGVVAYTVAVSAVWVFYYVTTSEGGYLATWQSIPLALLYFSVSVRQGSVTHLMPGAKV